MDAEKFGAFVAGIRKEKHMTQSELAAKIQVTDKAVSRWERGMGFPDINTLEPLANALGVSIHELMRSECVKENTCSDTEAVELMRAAAELERENRRQDQTAAALTVFTTVITAILFHMTGRGNIGASILFGLLASTAEDGKQA